MIILKSTSEIQLMQEAGRIVALALQEIGKAVKPGITTDYLDIIARDTIVNQGAIPAFKGLYGFPGHICVSTNSQVVHGIPGKQKLKEGDIVSVDVGVLKNDYNADAAYTFPVGKVSEQVQELLTVTEQALHKGIEKAVAGNRIGAISNAIQTHVKSYGFGIVQDYVGHGIGKSMHEPPQIPNFGPVDEGPFLKAGMVLAIEPMINLGTYKVKTLGDDWTVVTLDGKPSAHFEHTIAITDNGPKILTTL